MKNLFHFKAWIRTLMTWFGVFGIIYGFIILANQQASLWWLVGTFIVYQISMFTLSVGNHRLFSHKAFICNRFWHWFFAIWGTGFGNGSTFMWVFIHLGHHIHSDTPKDPHETTFKYFFRLKHKKIEYKIDRLIYRLKDPVYFYTHKYAILFVLMFPVLSSLISFEFFLFCYVIPMTWHQITGGLFYIYSHDKNGALDRFWIALLFPFAGEWLHKQHHTQGCAKILNNAHQPYQFDIGYYFAKMISSTK